MSYLSVLQQQHILSQEHQSSGGQVFHHMHGLGRQSLRGHSSGTLQWLCYCNSNAWEWHNSHQSDGITDQLILYNGRQLGVVQEEQCRTKKLACSAPDTMLCNLLQQPLTITFYD